MKCAGRRNNCNDCESARGEKRDDANRRETTRIVASPRAPALLDDGSYSTRRAETDSRASPRLARSPSLPRFPDCWYTCATSRVSRRAPGSTRSTRSILRLPRPVPFTRRLLSARAWTSSPFTRRLLSARALGPPPRAPSPSRRRVYPGTSPRPPTSPSPPPPPRPTSSPPRDATCLSRPPPRNVPRFPTRPPPSARRRRRRRTSEPSPPLPVAATPTPSSSEARRPPPPSAVSRRRSCPDRRRTPQRGSRSIADERGDA